MQQKNIEVIKTRKDEEENSNARIDENLNPKQELQSIVVTLLLASFIMYMHNLYQLNEIWNYDYRYYGSHEHGEMPQRSRNIMIIATYPNSPDQLAAIWSQIQCLSHDF